MALFFALEVRDRMSADHSRNVANHLMHLAKTWGLKGRELMNFYQAGLLHDIGKIGVSDRLLKSRNKYTKKGDCEEMKQHVRIGAILLKNLGFAVEKKKQKAQRRQAIAFAKYQQVAEHTAAAAEKLSPGVEETSDN